MRPLWGVGSVCALLLAAADVSAAWNNVFQVCCAGCGKQQAAVSQYAAAPAAPDACCNPCPQPVCTTRYVQRCYYQPVTSYTTKTYYEPVTTYRTSYYYEPVTTYRYSCYYDPCTGCSQQTACPTTSYRLRSQCCPVQSWVQRCCQVPVTSYRQCSYWEPVTSCCTPQPACCPTSYQAAAPAPAVQEHVQAAPAAPNYAAPAAPNYAAPAAPAVTEQRQAPAVQEYPQRNGGNGGSGSPLYDRYYPPASPAPSQMPKTEGSSLRQPAPRLPVIAPAPVPVTPPAVKLDRIVSLPHSNLYGRVVAANDDAPRANARLMFVSEAKSAAEQQVSADADGQFRVSLAKGGWLVYVQGNDNKPVFHSKIDVRDNESRRVVLVSR